jgi:pimeloyl-ACP methyl ester carboxylesterase
MNTQSESANVYAEREVLNEHQAIATMEDASETPLDNFLHDTTHGKIDTATSGNELDGRRTEITRRQFLAGSMAASLLPLNYAAAQEDEAEHLVIRKQGSFFVGGQKIFAEVNDGVVPPNAPLSGFGPGHIILNQAYVQFQIPANLKFKYPIFLTHGGGHHGAFYEATPDGRDGWYTHFARKGFAVYIVDDVNRGRSSYDIQDIDSVALGLEPASAIPRINKYSQERAWTAFRIGPTFLVPYPGSRFPVEAFDQYSAQLVPAWRNPIETNRNVAAFVALFDRVGPAILVTWSQSGTFGWMTAIQRPDLVKAIVGLEPGLPDLSTPGNLQVLATIPILWVIADHNQAGVDSAKAAAATLRAAGGKADVLALPEVGIFGNAHVMVIEKNNLEIADLIIERLQEMLS